MSSPSSRENGNGEGNGSGGDYLPSLPPFPDVEAVCEDCRYVSHPDDFTVVGMVIDWSCPRCRSDDVTVVRVDLLEAVANGQ